MWNVRAPGGFVINVDIILLDMAPDEDSVYIGDGVQIFTKESKRWHLMAASYGSIESTTSSVVIIFTSDGNKTSSGFKIVCSAIQPQIQKKGKLERLY